MTTLKPFERQTSAARGNTIQGKKPGSKTYTVIVSIILFLLLGATLLGSMNQDSAASSNAYVCYEIRTHSMYISETKDCGNDRLLTIQDLVGPTGNLGKAGVAGTAGDDGKTGATGATGAQGIQGEPGATGVTGPQGIQGLQGLQGLQGEPGETGAQGVQGIQGETGTQGIQGLQGVQGVQGIKGDTGADGTSVAILGSYATVDELITAHPTGTAGDGYLIDGDLYVWNPNDSNWINVGHIQGPKGDKGDQGIQGVQGLQGETGLQGLQGVQGIQGIQGLPGTNGIDGINGTNGVDGAQGIQGEKGDPGGFGSFGYYWDELTQTNPNPAVANAMMFRSPGEMTDISIANNSRITFAKAGVYNIVFSAQLSKTNGSSSDIYIWLRQNDFDVPFSATAVTIQGNTQKLVAAWNFFVTVEANDNVQIMWTSTDTSMQLLATVPLVANGTHPYIPAIPSLILTVNQVQ